MRIDAERSPHPQDGQPGVVGGIALTDPAGRTDLANARRIVAMHGRDIRFCPEWNVWLCWDGKRWKRDSDGHINRIAKSVADAIWTEAGTLGDEVRKFANYAAATRGMNAAIALAKSEPGIPISVAELDGNPWLFNTVSGTVDLQTGKLQPHSRADFITRLCPTPYGPDADHAGSIWFRFLRDVFDGDADLELFVSRLFGYGMTGSTREQKLAIFHGRGANGKSTLLEAIMSAMGEDYAGPVPPELLLVNRSDSHPTVLANLYGKRLAACSETEDGKRLNEPLVKWVTGGDTIAARGLYQDYWTFQPTHTLILSTNYRPEVRGVDHGIKRRLLLVPFNRQFDNPDPSMPDKLRSESAAILSWLVAGAVEWHERCLDPPASVQSATREYSTQADVVGRFIDECCVTSATAVVGSQQLHDVMKAWAADEGETLPSVKAVSQQLEDRGFKKRRSNGAKFFGIGLAV